MGGAMVRVPHHLPTLDTRTTTTERASTTEAAATHLALTGICKTRASTDQSSPTTTTTTPTIPTYVTGATTVMMMMTTLLLQMFPSAASCTRHSTCTLLWTRQRSNSEVPRVRYE